MREEEKRQGKSLIMRKQVRPIAPHLSLEEITHRMKREPRFWVRQRWWIMYHALLMPGSTTEIAQQAAVSARTVQRVIATYNSSGPAALETRGTGGRRHACMSLEHEHRFLTSLAERAERGEMTTVRHIREALEAEVKHSVSLSTVYRLLHRHGWRKLVPRPRHPKANADEQAAFLANFSSIVAAAVATRDPADQRPVLVMAADQGRFGRISTVKRAWAPPGMRPRSARQVVREYVYVYTAVAPAEGKMTSLILPTVDSAMMSLFLEHVGKTFADFFLVMQVDQASWHHAEDLQVPENIRLLPQPAYSPELNPTEHIWEDLREKQFPNVACSSLEEV